MFQTLKNTLAKWLESWARVLRGGGAGEEKRGDGAGEEKRGGGAGEEKRGDGAGEEK